MCCFHIDVILQPLFGNLHGSGNTSQRETFEKQTVNQSTGLGINEFIGGMFNELTTALLAEKALFTVVDVPIFDGVLRLTAETLGHGSESMTSVLP
ncbi:hypothetical protein AWQ23_02080 [Picosynechococcus sp. PCC 73109]|nr:hypothetical protein AWQ23_02080 [Picosynechococcus sp. PCC 73109]